VSEPLSATTTNLSAARQYPGRRAVAFDHKRHYPPLAKDYITDYHTHIMMFGATFFPFPVGGGHSPFPLVTLI